MQMATAAKIVFALGIGMIAGLGTPVVGTAAAQNYLTAQADSQGMPPSRDQLLNKDYLAPTGETVPNPGRSQIGPESEQEKGAQRRSDRDTHSICSNCE
jgi:hypothetical protein